jgi:tricorn protease
VHRFDLGRGTLEPIVELVSGFGDADEEAGAAPCANSADGSSMLYKRRSPVHRRYRVEGGSRPDAAAHRRHAGALRSARRVAADVRGRRIERDFFFYDPHHHGLDLAARRSTPYLDRIGSRADLNALFEEMLGELTVGHLSPVRGGDLPHVEQRSRASWAPITSRRALPFRAHLRWRELEPGPARPLTQPGSASSRGVPPGGQPLTAADEVYAFFRRPPRRSCCASAPGPTAATRATSRWCRWRRRVSGTRPDRGNRRAVDWLTAAGWPTSGCPDCRRGYASFNRYYFAQVDREGRSSTRNNGGGYIADYIIDVLKRTLTSPDHPHRRRLTLGSIPGPKAMIINQYAGRAATSCPGRSSG